MGRAQTEAVRRSGPTEHGLPRHSRGTLRAHHAPTAHTHTHRPHTHNSSLRDSRHNQQNIESILDKGLLVPGKGKGKDVGHATDTGFWGGGIYLSPNSSMSVGYCRGTLTTARTHRVCAHPREAMA